LSKDETKHFTRTTPPTLNEIKEAVQIEDANIIYKNSQSKYRNLKQCCLNSIN
jgi:hypothetical protein